MQSRETTTQSRETTTQSRETPMQSDEPFRTIEKNRWESEHGHK